MNSNVEKRLKEIINRAANSVFDHPSRDSEDRHYLLTLVERYREELERRLARCRVAGPCYVSEESDILDLLAFDPEVETKEFFKKVEG